MTLGAIRASRGDIRPRLWDSRLFRTVPKRPQIFVDIVSGDARVSARKLGLAIVTAATPGAQTTGSMAIQSKGQRIRKSTSFVEGIRFLPSGEKSPLQCAGLNRLEVEDARALRERSSDPLGLESCAATARDTAKRRQRIGGVGIQLRKDAIRTPTSL
jgi:hypothetical protein